jgi:type IV secretion system protein VirD4
MAPPQVGKTGLLADWILTWPGAVLATSTKPDLFALTSGIRQRPGFFALPSALPVPGAGPFPLAPGIRQRTSPVHVFNPQNIGSTPSTFGWDPLPGCQDPATAIRRADAFAGAVDQSGVEGGGWFGKRAGAYMRALFCAAALDGRDMTAVSGWALSLEIKKPQEILRRHGRERWALELGQLRGEAKRTIETIQITMTASLGFMNDPHLLQCVLPAEGFDLDIPSFLRERGTLYLVGRMQGEDAPLAPLFAALAGEIHYQGVLLASMQPGGRLDPPLLMALDEATQICPVPVPTWVADSGGQGITIATVCHGEAPLVRRWGESGKQTILDCSQAKIFLSGISAPHTLEMISKLAGDAGYTEAGQEHTTRHPIATEAMARQIPAGYEVVIRADRAPVIARTPRAWRNWRFLWARVTRRKQALVQAVPPVAAAPEHLPAEPWPADGEFRPAPVSPDTPHPWNKAPASKGPNGNGRQRNGSGRSGGTRDGH